ncbi:MAG TPA: MotA/TolQ/ExbB proton channel family protein [Candidatus Binatia bacterium]|jgi:biopolymer transport protein ExbB
MDPTAAASPESVATSISIIDLVRNGWYVTYPLIAMSVMITSIMIERLWIMRGLAGSIDGVTESACASLAAGDAAGAGATLQGAMTTSPAARVYAPLVSLLGRTSADDLLEYGERRRLDEVRRLKGSIWLLGTVAASAPFIGLLGTVIGIIKSFHQMAVMGTGGFAVVAAGISEALVATALGLLVAILALLFFNYFQVRIGNLDTQLRVGLGRFVEAGAAGSAVGER